ncbi:MAG: hypothetical protein ACREMJ_07970 [Gemmatimonadales bacterium]
MMPRTMWLAILVAAVACSGAGGERSVTTDDTLTQRQRDSILAQSKIPGASGVGKAMRVADSVSARIRATDTIVP